MEEDPFLEGPLLEAVPFLQGAHLGVEDPTEEDPFLEAEDPFLEADPFLEGAHLGVEDPMEEETLEEEEDTLEEEDPVEGVESLVEGDPLGVWDMGHLEDRPMVTDQSEELPAGSWAPS